MTNSEAYSGYSQTVRFLIQYLLSIVIAVLNGLLPVLFKFLVKWEDYTPAFVTNITLVRSVQEKCYSSYAVPLLK